MKQLTLIAAAALFVTAPALAQSTPSGQNTAGPTNSGPGATVTTPARSGTATDTSTATTNSAAGGNAEQTQKPAPSTGSTGGGNTTPGG